MPVFGWIYFLCAVLLYFLIGYLPVEKDQVMAVMQLTFAAVFALLMVFDLARPKATRWWAMAPAGMTLLLLGGAMKWTWWPYGEDVMKIGLALTVIAIFGFFVKRTEEGVKARLRSFILAAIPIGAISLVLMGSSSESLFRFSYQQLKPWSLEERIEWGQFTGMEPKGAHYDATIRTQVKYRYRVEFGELHYVVGAFFYPRESWTVVETPPLLEHERVHFDLTQVYASRVENYLLMASRTGETDTEKIQTAIDNLLSEWDRVQEHYDAVTSHGLQFDEQMTWQSAVDSLLLKHAGIQSAPSRFTEYDDWYAERDFPNDGDYAGISASEPIYEEVDWKPYFPGGDTAFRSWLQEHLILPDAVVQGRVEGVVSAEAVVEPNGEIEVLYFTDTLGFGCESEVQRLVSTMPVWQPAVLNEKFVRAQITLYIPFKVNPRR